MKLSTDAMPGTMHEVGTVTCLRDDIACGIVYVTTTYRRTCRQTLPHKSNRTITGTTHRLKHLALTCWNLITRSHKGHPGQITPDCIGTRESCPEVEEHQITTTQWAMQSSSRLIMWIAGIIVHCHNGEFILW